LGSLDSGILFSASPKALLVDLARSLNCSSDYRLGFAWTLAQQVAMSSLDTFTNEELDMFLESLEEVMPLSIPTLHLHQISDKLTSSFQDGLKTSSAAMLPSHVYCLPSGSETGTFLSVDLGGSTLRVALVKLSGLHKTNEDEKNIDPMEMLELKCWSGKDIDQLKHLKGEEFFDWIALHIAEVSGKYAREGGPLPMGLSWSFPIE